MISKRERNNDTPYRTIFSIDEPYSIAYNTLYSNDLFATENLTLANYLTQINDKAGRCFLILDSNVEKLYGAQIKNYFHSHHIAYEFLSFYCAEDQKTLQNTQHIIEFLIDHKITRLSDPIVAIGGGILMDMVGFAASIYRRGTRYIRIPTTLVGLIDAGIGVKTAINFGGYKNRIGSFYAPKTVFLDPFFLSTLDQRNLANGIAEIIKMGLVKDQKLFELLEQNAKTLIEDKLHGQPEYDEILYRAAISMLEELSGNLLEKNLERAVDFGHSFSPKIEMNALPELLHGEAVAIDMAFSVLLSEHRGLMTTAERNRTLTLLQQFKLPLTHKVCIVELLISALDDIVLHRDGQQHFPLTKGIGQVVFVNDITHEEIKKIVEQMRVMTQGTK